MQINITGHQIDVTPALRDYVTGKFDRLARFFDNVTNVHVVLEVQKQSHKAEATVHVAGGDLFADAKAEDMYAAIDALADKLDRQIKKHKEKVTDHHRVDGAAMKTQPVEEAE